MRTRSILHPPRRNTHARTPRWNIITDIFTFFFLRTAKGNIMNIIHMYAYASMMGDGKDGFDDITVRLTHLPLPHTLNIISLAISIMMILFLQHFQLPPSSSFSHTLTISRIAYSLSFTNYLHIDFYYSNASQQSSAIYLTLGLILLCGSVRKCGCVFCACVCVEYFHSHFHFFSLRWVKGFSESWRGKNFNKSKKTLFVVSWWLVMGALIVKFWGFLRTEKFAKINFNYCSLVFAKFC